MQIVNETHYPTRELRKMMTAVHNAEAKKLGRLPQWMKVVVTIRYCRGWRGYSGWAYANGTESTLSIPPDWMRRGAFCALWRHELWHLYGYEHREYPKRILKCYDMRKMVRDHGWPQKLWEPGKRWKNTNSGKHRPFLNGQWLRKQQ